MTTTDPNADLIGRTVTIEKIEYTVTGTPSWSDQYVLLDRKPGAPGFTVCLANLVRAHPA